MALAGIFAERLSYLQTSRLRCCTRAEFHDWSQGGEHVANVGHSTGDFCRDADRAWCEKKRGQHRCALTEEDFIKLLEHDAGEDKRDDQWAGVVGEAL